MNKELLYRVQFVNNGKFYQIFVKEIVSSSIWGFVEIADFVFNSENSLLLDPNEEKLKSEFSGVTRCYLPMNSIIRIDSVEKKGESKIQETQQNDRNNIIYFPQSPEKN